MTGTAVDVQGVSRRYQHAGRGLDVLQGVDLRLDAGEAVGLVGPSGSGKSTFLHLLGLLDRPDAGHIHLDGVDVTRLGERERDRLRNRGIGFVFQAHHLLPDLDAVSNVALPVRLAGGSRAVAEARAEALLRAVGLRERLRHRPSQLSGGEQQRVAIARALVMGPGLVLADEPTGNLDPQTAAGVFALLLELNRQLGSTLLVVTHAADIAARFPRRVRVVAGRLVEE